MMNKRNGAADTDMPSNLSFNADVAPLNGLTPRAPRLHKSIENIGAQKAEMAKEKCQGSS